MIKLLTPNKIRFVLTACVLFLLSYILKINLGVAFLLSAIIAYLYSTQRTSFLKNHNFLNLTLLYTILLSGTYLLVKNNISVLWFPFCAITMLVVILFNDLRVALLFTLASSLTVGAIAGNSLNFTFLYLISGIASCIAAYGARKRSVIVKSGLLIGLFQACVLFSMLNFQSNYYSAYLILLINGLACGIIVIGVLPLFEYLFKTVTNISLLELADFNQPVLQRLNMEAPGTYHHSLIVGNLSDAACTAIGANGLLARIGAYYHDIGKLSKPEYFSENQISDSSANKHDTLSPEMSKLVIMNHVKEGIDFAKQYKLNPQVIDFIEQHHGSSLVYYFYRRALENSEVDEHVEEEGFRYPGPKPNTKETAIVLLADSVEAATRALHEPNSANIEDMVHKIINNKFIDGQLDECDLTLKDLEKISRVFIRILNGIYHSRVTYPKK